MRGAGGKVRRTRGVGSGRGGSIRDACRWPARPAPSRRPRVSAGASLRQCRELLLETVNRGGRMGGAHHH
eukprot:13271-Chlamydomonas_euryale.AAC.1